MQFYFVSHLKAPPTVLHESRGVSTQRAERARPAEQTHLVHVAGAGARQGDVGAGQQERVRGCKGGGGREEKKHTEAGKLMGRVAVIVAALVSLAPAVPVRPPSVTVETHLGGRGRDEKGGAGVGKGRGHETRREALVLATRGAQPSHRERLRQEPQRHRPGWRRRRP